jgi:deoxycytidine triphosphate deaminase
MSEGLIGHAELKRLFGANRIFQPNTWSRDGLRGASYDLRAARDGLKDPSGRRYPPGEDYPEATLQLKQGDAAILSSVERLCIPWDVAGIMGVKFNLARRGILMLTGVSLDPGYGLRYLDGAWVPKDDQRVHFLMTNVGVDPVEIRLGVDPVASVQFVWVAEPSDSLKIELAGALNRTTAENSELATGGLGFFNALEELRLDHAKLRQTVAKETQDSARKLRDLRHDISVTSELTNSLLNLGVFVVLATVFLGTLGVVFGVAQSPGLAPAFAAIAQALPSSWPAAVVAVSICLVLGLLLLTISRGITRGIRRPPDTDQVVEVAGEERDSS